MMIMTIYITKRDIAITPVYYSTVKGVSLIPRPRLYSFPSLVVRNMLSKLCQNCVFCTRARFKVKWQTLARMVLPVSV